MEPVDDEVLTNKEQQLQYSEDELDIRDDVGHDLDSSDNADDSM